MSIANDNSFKYRSDIDGLRAVAVLAVLFYHLGIGCSGGYVGVDVFFVISGYLITGLLLRDIDCGRFKILGFWERRVRRILPALAVVVCISLIMGWFFFLPLDFKNLGQSVVAQAMLVSNIYFWRSSDYFSPAAKMSPLLHTWSLAVEEQFYLLFPFLLLALKRFSRKVLVKAIILICGISFGLSVYYSYFRPSANFYLLPARVWEILIGSFLAVLPVRHSPSGRLAEVLSWGGLITILCTILLYDSKTRFPGVSALLPCGGTVLVIWANGKAFTSSGKLLALRPMVFIGLISYSLYLWHWPLVVFSKYWTIGVMQQSQRIFIFFASIFLAVLSWRFVEIPFRKGIIYQGRRMAFTFAGSLTVVLLLAGLTIWKTQGAPFRIPAEVLKYKNGNADLTALRASSYKLGLKEALANDFIELGAGNKSLPIDLLVWGDSHAGAVLPVMNTLCKEHSIRGVAAILAGTAPLVGYRSHGAPVCKADNIALNNEIVKFILRNRVRNVVLIARWDYYIDFIKEGRDAGRLRASVLDTVKALQGSGAKIWIMRQIPKPHWNVPSALAVTVWRGFDSDGLGVPFNDYYTEFKRQNPIFDGLNEMYPEVTVIDPTEQFINSNYACRVVVDGQAIYCDDDHLSIAGAMMLKPIFLPIFDGICKCHSVEKQGGDCL